VAVCASVVGARPQFIKAAIVERELRQVEDFRVEGIHTGQHYDPNMSKVFFDELDIRRPAVELHVGSGSHAEQIGRMLVGLEAALSDLQPDIVVVYGDTNTTLAAAIVAARLEIPLAHVEAGLRSGRQGMPEEQNRIVTDHLSGILFAPTANAVKNLEIEGLAAKASVHMVGDVMRDAFETIRQQVDIPAVCSSRGVVPGQYVLATVHRAENVDNGDRFREIVRGLSTSPWPVLWPIHPRTRRRLSEVRLPSTIQVCEPVGFKEMIALEAGSRLIVTDSGGVQKEALWSRRQCITVRDETEWPETVDAGWNSLAGASAEAIERALSSEHQPNPDVDSLYGKGDSGHRISELIAKAVL
jgi:UDP-GlcNAc3NAcA epimerase